MRLSPTTKLKTQDYTPNLKLLFRFQAFQYR
nr:MAG TPA: hypothetical protein [Caudoviricetes sp.]